MQTFRNIVGFSVDVEDFGWMLRVSVYDIDVLW